MSDDFPSSILRVFIFAIGIIFQLIIPAGVVVSTIVLLKILRILKTQDEKPAEAAPKTVAKPVTKTATKPKPKA